MSYSSISWKQCVWLCIPAWALPWHKIRCHMCKGNRSLTICFIIKELNWNEVIFNLKTQATASLLPSKVKSIRCSCLLWLPQLHRFGITLARSLGNALSFHCHPGLTYSSAPGWEEASCSSEHRCGMLRSLLALSHCLPHPMLQLSFPEEFASWFLLNTNRLSFQRIPDSKCEAGTVRLTCSLSPICLTTSF